MSIERTKEDQDRFHADMARIASLPVTKAIEAMERKPTAPAMRGARRIYIEADKIRLVEDMANVIDRETGLPELIDACRLASCVEQANLDDLRAQGELEDGANICACKQSIAIYKAAIAKAEGT